MNIFGIEICASYFSLYIFRCLLASILLSLAENIINPETSDKLVKRSRPCTKPALLKFIALFCLFQSVSCIKAYPYILPDFYSSGGRDCVIYLFIYLSTLLHQYNLASCTLLYNPILNSEGMFPS